MSRESNVLLGVAVAGMLGVLLLAAVATPVWGYGGNAWISSTATLFFEPVGCWQPPDDYTREWVYGEQFNARTLTMLDHAQEIYQAQGGSVVDFRLAITQGGYNAGGVAASFGTHDGGGAVDLSVRSRVDWSVMTDEIEPMIRALRVAGFAAWLREADSLYPGSPIHIHAIAIGDRDLSSAARAQIDGYFGYLRGYDGIPRFDAVAQPDPHGGPVICKWMIAQGFGDLRGAWNPLPTPGGTSIAVTALP
jgi:hypothetical protein